MIKSLQRNRETKGPTPHSVALFARSTNKRPPEHLILESRKMDDLRAETLATLKLNKQCELKSAWEKMSNKKVMNAMVKKEVQWYFMQEQAALEERKDRLREMFLAEEEQYIKEMELKQETIEERQIKMKERANYLKEKREAERQALVEKKLEQKFRGECEELRSMLSKRNRDEIFSERKEQIAMKELMKNNEREVENFYVDLWNKDKEAKARREELEALGKMERNQDMLEVLNLQRAALEEQKKERKELKKMEAEWLKEEANLRKYEEEKLMEGKRQKQLAARRNREISLQLKKRKEAKEKQEELALDMKILEQALQETRNEAAEDKDRKRKMHVESQRFMHYLDMNRKEELEREKEMERMMNMEVQKQWDKKDQHKRLQKEARATLMRNVLETREKQMNERDEIVRREQERALQEKKELLQQMEEHKRLETDRLERLRQTNKRYQKDLEQQIQFQRMQKEKEIDEARKELEIMQDAERHYQRRFKSALETPDTQRSHPLRIKGLGYTSRATSC